MGIKQQRQMKTSQAFQVFQVVPMATKVRYCASQLEGHELRTQLAEARAAGEATAASTDALQTRNNVLEARADQLAREAREARDQAAGLAVCF